MATPPASPSTTGPSAPSPAQVVAQDTFCLSLVQSSERPDIERLLTRAAADLLGSQRCALFSYDPALILLNDLSGQSVPENALTSARWPASLPPFMEEAVRQRRPTMWSGVDRPLDTASRAFAQRAKIPTPPVSPITRAVRERLNDREALSALCVPIISGGELYGLAVYHDPYPRTWEAHDTAPAQRIGQTAAVALRMARRLEREKRRRKVAEGLAEVATAISASLDLEEILGRTARYAAELLSAPLAGLVVVDQAMATAPSAHYGPPAYASLWSECQRILQQAGWLDDLAAGQVIAKVNTASERIAGEWFREHGVVSLLLAPLRDGERLIAMLGVAYTDSPHRFTRAEVELVERFAQQTCVAVANADQYRRQRRRAEQMRSLAEVSAALSSTLDLDRVLKLILEQLGRVIEFDNAAIEQLDGDTLSVIAEYGKEPTSAVPMRINIRDNYLARQVLEERKPIVLGDAPRHPDFIRMDRRVRSWIGAPLLVADQPIGMLVVDAYHPDRYNEDDAQVVAQFARQAALAIDRARLFAAERAGRRQAALLLEMTRAVSASLDLDEVLTRAARDIAAAAGVVHCGGYLVDAHRPRLHLRASAGRAPKAVIARPALVQHLRASGEPVVLDPATDGRVDRNTARLMGVASLLAVPFIHRDRLVGVALATAYDRPTTFDREQLQLAQGIARSAAVAIDNAALYQEQERRVNQLSALNQIGQAAAALLRQDEIVELVYQQTSRVLNTRNFYIALLDDDGELVIATEANAEGDERDAPRIERGKGLTWYVVDTGQPLYVRDGYAEACERLGVTPVGRSSRSWLGVPLLAGGHCLGAIVLQDYEHDEAYDEDDVAVLSTIANQTAIALENARLFGEVQQRVQQLIGIASVGAAIVQQRDVERVLATVANHVRGLTSSEHVLISLVREDAPGLDVVMAVGPRAQEMYDLRVPVEGSLASVAIETREAQFSADAPNDPRVYAPNIARANVHNLLIVPLVTQDRVLGVITAINKRAGAFDTGDLETVSVMANLAAVAFENAHLYGLSEQHALELKALNEIGQRISRSLALDTVLRVIVTASAQLLRAEHSVLFLVEDNRLLARASYGRDSMPARLRYEPKDSVSGYVVRRGFPVIIHDVAQDGRIVRDMPDAEGIRSLLEVPVHIGGAIAGVLVVGSNRPHAFDDSQQELLSALASQAAIAIDNARLYEQAGELAVLEERNRMAQELHDTLAQGFTGIVLQLEAAEQVLAEQPEEALTHLTRARSLARASLAEARWSVWNLRPPSLENGLPDAIQQALVVCTADNRVTGHFVVDGEPYEIPVEAQKALLRIAQESFTNLRKHAQASNVWATLVYAPDEVTITVRDDGVGFDPTTRPPSRAQGGGMGLSGMRERAQKVRASFTLQTAPGQGTIIEVRLPVSAE